MDRHLDIVKLVLKRGFPIDFKNKKGETTLVISLQYGKTGIATCLIYHGACIVSCDTQGINILSHARRLLQRVEHTRILCIDQTSSDQSTSPKMKTVADKDRKDVMTYVEDWNPSIAMRNRDHQGRIDRTQLIINVCMADKNLRNSVRNQRKNRARDIRPLQFSISRCAMQTTITVFRDAYNVPITTDKKTFAYLERG
jgi:hypothetical protein